MESSNIYRGVKLTLENRLFINNEFVSGTKNQTIPIINPATEEKIIDVALGTEEDIDLAVNAALEAFSSWEGLSCDERAKLFFALAQKLEDNLEEFSVMESLDNGKPYGDAREDILEVIRCIRYYGGWTDKVVGATYANLGEFSIQSRRVPLGVVGLIPPWNFPLLMCAWKLFPALAAGNTTVLKCSEETPLTMLRLCHFFKEVGFPKGVVNVVNGLGAVAGEYLARHPKVAKVSFTGSTAIGKRVLKNSAETNLKKVHLELGGKSPFVVFADADIEEAVKWAISAAFANASQNCCCGSRIYVQEQVYDQFLKRFVEETKKLKTSSFLENDNYLGPVINKRQFERILEYIRIGKEDEKLNLETGGRRLFEKGYFIEPTVFSNVPDDSRLVKEEIFGPVSCITKPFKDIYEVVKRANDSVYGLAAGIFTKDHSKVEYFVRNVEAGTIWVNNYNYTNYNIPFGGFKESGFGRDNGYEAILEYTTTKGIYYKYDFSNLTKF